MIKSLFLFPVGQANRKSSHNILSRVNTNPSPAESDLSLNSSDGNSEFEEALKNIKALNGQSRYSDNEAEEKTASSPAENSSTDKNVFDIKLKSDENNTPDSLSPNYTKKSETPFNSESVSKLKSNLGSIFSKLNSESMVEKEQKVFCKDVDNDSNEPNCDKTDLLKDKKDSEKDKSNQLNHLNSPFEKSANQTSQDNGDHCKTESLVSHLGSDEKIRDSFKTFLQKSPNYNKMLLKKKEDTNVQSVTSTSDSQSSSKLNKTSSVRGNLFETFESIASPETEEKDDDDDDDGRQKEEMIDCTTKSNGQAGKSLF